MCICIYTHCICFYQSFLTYMYSESRPEGWSVALTFTVLNSIDWLVSTTNAETLLQPINYCRLNKFREYGSIECEAWEITQGARPIYNYTYTVVFNMRGEEKELT